MKRSIKQTLRKYFIGVAVIPLVITGFLTGIISYKQQIEHAIHLQEEMSGIAIEQITAFFKSAIQNQIMTSLHLQNIIDLTDPEIKSYISHLITYKHPKYNKLFNSLAILDSKTGSFICESLYTDCSRSDFTGKKKEIIKSEGHFSSVFFDKETGLPYMYYTLQVNDLITGKIRKTLIANVRLQSIWDTISEISFAKGDSVYLADDNGSVVAHKDPSIILKSTTVTLLLGSRITKGFSGNYSLITTVPVSIGNQSFSLVVEQSLYSILKPVFYNLLVILLVLFIAFAVAIRFGFIGERYLTKPIYLLTEKVKEINLGLYSNRLKLERDDEFGILADAFNMMGGTIDDSISSLQNEVQERKRVQKLLKEYQDDLEEKIGERTKELTVMNISLEESQNKLLQSAKLLEKSEREYKDLYENSSTGLVSIRFSDKKVLRCNPAFLELTGYTRNEISDRTLNSIIVDDEESLVSIESVLKNSFEPKLLSTSFFRVIKKNETSLWIKLSVDFIEGASGDISEIRCSISDFTDYYTTYEELKLHNEIINKMVEGVYLVRSSDGVIVYTSPTFERMFGYEKGEMMGQAVDIVNAPTDKDPEQIATVIIKDLNQKGFWNGEILNIKKDGTTFWCRATVTSFESKKHGTVWLSVHEDITEKRELLVELTNKEAEYRNLINTMNEGLFKLDANWKIQFFNKAFSHITGYSDRELMGKSIYDFVTEEDQTLFKNRHSAIKKGRQALSQEDLSIDIEMTIVCADGKKKIIRDSASPMFDIHGNYEGGVGVITDITQLKEAQKEKQKFEEQLKAAVDVIDESFAIFDRDDKLVLYNQKSKDLYRLSDDIIKKGICFEEILRMGVSRGQYYDAIGNEEEWIKHRMKAHRSPGKSLEERIGKNQWMRVKEKKMSDGGTVGIRIDVSAFKKNEERLSDLLAEKDVLLREIHHRVKNNLAVITSLLNLQMNALGSEVDRSIFFESQNRIKAMSLIHESLYRNENLEEIFLEDYINALVTNLLFVYRGKQNHVKIRVDTNNVNLDIDEGITCGLILNELISNAFKYAFPDNKQGSIKITTSYVDESYVKLAVQDDGVGFDSDIDLERPKSLGLKIVSLLAKKQLGGTLDITAENGTLFVLQWRKGGEEE